MDLAFIYIGLAQSIFSAVLIFLKKPPSIADKILTLWLLAIGGMFALNVVKIHYGITTDLWPVSLNLAFSFPIFLYLYTKYVIGDYQRFRKLDYLHFLPPLAGLVTLYLYFPSLTKSVNELKTAVDSQGPSAMAGYAFRLYLWLYCILAFIMIVRYRRRFHNFFSFKSYKVSLNWLIFIIISFLAVYNFIIYISSLHYSESIPHVERFRSGALLVFIYILSIWGFKQSQLSTNIKPPKLNLFNKEKNSQSDKYKKSGLTKEDGEVYSQKLIQHMNTSQTWRNNELTVGQLAAETDIPKHHITQVLNEYINKNFYTFVNEYRVENAMAMLKSPEYDNWSFVGIAFESGFNSKTVFNIFFKKYTGMTPSEFKRKKSA